MDLNVTLILIAHVPDDDEHVDNNDGGAAVAGDDLTSK